MILKGAQRGNAKQLALHLLNAAENDFVDVHEVSGFLSSDVSGAFKEVQAIARGTRCRQPFFSVSLSPPPQVRVTVAMFEAAATRVAAANGLAGQPRVLLFHEKDGRRHAHLVISRIDAQTMTARNLPHFKNKLQALSRELFLEHQWKMPPGLRDRSLKSPTAVSLAEWQAAKRRGKNAIDQKRLIQQCWAVSDGRAGFEAALGDHGYILARGDRRGAVVVCHDGEVLAVARATGLKAKAVRERLGDIDALPSVAQAMQRHAHDIRGQFVRMAGDARRGLSRRRAALEAQRARMIARHRQERMTMEQGQARRWREESAARQARLHAGLKGLWQRFSGQRRPVLRQNIQEAHACLRRDQRQRQYLIDAQLAERRLLERERAGLRQEAFGLVHEMRGDRDRLLAKFTAPRAMPSRRSSRRQRREHGLEPDFEP